VTRLSISTVEGFKLTACLYCGQTATARDHFVPRSYRRIIAEWRKQEGWESVPDTVPVCNECNGIAGSSVFRAIGDKRRYIQARLRQRHRRALDAPFWAEEDLDELGTQLRSHVEAHEGRRMRLLLRLSWPYQVGEEVEALPPDARGDGARAGS